MIKKIIALWATPRSRSTAFMWMIKQRGDFVVVQEPFGRSAYYSEERIFNRASDIQTKPEYNYQNVWQQLKIKAQNNQLFIKDFPYYFMPIVDDYEFIDSFQHTFLIREPAQMLTSYYYKMPDMSFKECGYKELYELFNKVVDRTGEIPTVINADDLVKNAVNTIKMYCQRIGIPFIAEALKWNPPGKSDEIGWWGDRSWNDDLRISYGFQDIKQSYLNIDENEHLKYLYSLCMPYYEGLNQYCLNLENQ